MFIFYEMAKWVILFSLKWKSIIQLTKNVECIKKYKVI